MDISVLDLSYLPLNSAVGFIEMEIAGVTRSFEDWMLRLGRHMRKRSISGSLVSGLDSLVPMSWPSTRHLFWATRNGWTVVLDNGAGDSLPTTMSYLSGVLKCRGIRAVWSPHIPFKGQRGEHGASILEVYGPSGGGALSTVRTIAKVHDGKWRYAMFGTPLPFEKVDDGELRSKWSRSMLLEYVSNLGVKSEDMNFLATSGVLYEEQAEWADRVRTRTLEEAQYDMRLHEVDLSRLT